MNPIVFNETVIQKIKYRKREKGERPENFPERKTRL